jgi:hypothetical protein
MRSTRPVLDSEMLLNSQRRGGACIALCTVRDDLNHVGARRNRDGHKQALTRRIHCRRPSLLRPAVVDEHLVVGGRHGRRIPSDFQNPRGFRRTPSILRRLDIWIRRRLSRTARRQHRDGNDDPQSHIVFKVLPLARAWPPYSSDLTIRTASARRPFGSCAVSNVTLTPWSS